MVDLFNMLGEVDADEVSPVFRGANRKGVVLKGGDVEAIDSEVADILAVPWDHEGAMVDALRKEDADDVVMKSAIASMRLLNGIAPELPDDIRESVEKLGRELYSRQNPPLNQRRGVGNGGELVDDESNPDDLEGHASGAPKDGSARDGELIGSGSAPKVAAEQPDDDEDDVAKAAYDEECAKADRTFSAASRRSMARSGVALPDGSFPIPDRDALGRAITSVGRGKNNPKSKIRAHIIARARALGATASLPDGWVRKESAVTKALRVVSEALGKSQDEREESPEETGGVTVPDEEPDNVNKGGDTVGETTVAVPIKKEDGTWDLTGVPEEARPFYESMIEKADRQEKELEEARDEIKKTREELDSATLVHKAASFKFVAPGDDLTLVLKEAGGMSEEGREALERVLSGANERIEKSGLFEELGKTHGEQTESPGDAWSQIEKAASEIVEKDAELSQDQAIDLVLKTATGRKLYRQYLAENTHLAGGAV